MSLVLRPYQQQIIDELRSRMQAGQRRLLVCSPTGSGKTALTASMLGAAADKGMRSWFNVHRRELIKQSAVAFDKAEVYHGIISNGFADDTRAPVQICSVPSLARRYTKIRAPKLIIWDEAHHIASTTWENIFKFFPEAFHVGLTATPERLDGKGLSDYFDHIVQGPSVQWLIENKFLSPYRLFAPSSLSMQGVKTYMGDFKKSDVMEIVDKPTITGSAINEYKKVAKGKRAVVFCVSIKHSQHVVEEFNAHGITAVHVDGETSISKRDAAIERFRNGNISVLSNVDLFGEGFDLPAIECAILLRPTQSLGLYLQQVGRVLRTYPGKTEAIILDHVGNVERHGLPDEEREWSLLGKRGRQASGKQDGPGVKICDRCFAAQLPGKPKCDYCDFEFKKQERVVEEVDGDLVEVDPNVLRKQKKQEQAQAKTLEDLVQIGISRGYKRPRLWAKHVFNGRQRKKIGG